MNPERFTRLNCKVQSFTDSGGGKVDFTVQDLAACMANLTPIQTWILYRKYINAEERGQGYMQLWRHAFFKVWEADKLPKDKGRTLDLFEIAIQDYIGGIPCPKCKGKSEIHHENKIYKCSSNRCFDGKLTHRLDSERAREMKVDKTVYSRQYRPAYDIIAEYLTRTIPEAESRAMAIAGGQAR